MPMDKGYARLAAKVRDLRHNATDAERALRRAISAQQKADAGRTRFPQAKGCRVIRFWNNDVLGNLDGVLADIERVIACIPSPNPAFKREESYEDGLR